MLSYKEATEFLFNQLPAFEKVGESGYKPGLERVVALSAAFGRPHARLKRVIHVAGTNGKGSTSHTLAAILQAQGYRVGLFTSPHLVDFRERIRVNGSMISEEEVVRFVDTFRGLDIEICPSFFELTTIMAFKYFADMNVDIAVVEGGLGGRLDSTNIITPTLSVITNISLDHTGLLGNTRAMIAREKAGIIKEGRPVLIGETDAEITPVFESIARDLEAPIYFAENIDPLIAAVEIGGLMKYTTRSHGTLQGDLTGECQIKNTRTVLAAIDIFRGQGVDISDRAVQTGLRNVVALTGLAGRWQTVGKDPLTVCDTGHNPAGWRYSVDRLASLPGTRHIVIGFVADKDVREILSMIAARKIGHAIYHFVAPDSHRAMPADRLRSLAAEVGLSGHSYGSVAEGYKKALADAGKGDSIFIGGSNYVVAEALAIMQR